MTSLNRYQLRPFFDIISYTEPRTVLLLVGTRKKEGVGWGEHAKRFVCQACCGLLRDWTPEETSCDPQDCQGAHYYCGVHPIQSIMMTLTLAAKWQEREADIHRHLVNDRIKNTRNKTSAFSHRSTTPCAA